MEENPKQATPFSYVEQKVHDLAKDAESFYNKGNKTAGSRLRMGMQELKGLAQNVRTDISNRKNG